MVTIHGTAERGSGPSHISAVPRFVISIAVNVRQVLGTRNRPLPPTANVATWVVFYIGRLRWDSHMSDYFCFWRFPIFPAFHQEAQGTYAASLTCLITNPCSRWGEVKRPWLSQGYPLSFIIERRFEPKFPVPYPTLYHLAFLKRKKTTTTPRVFGLHWI